MPIWTYWNFGNVCHIRSQINTQTIFWPPHKPCPTVVHAIYLETTFSSTLFINVYIILSGVQCTFVSTGWTQRNWCVSCNTTVSTALQHNTWKIRWLCRREEGEKQSLLVRSRFLYLSPEAHPHYAPLGKKEKVVSSLGVTHFFF